MDGRDGMPCPSPPGSRAHLDGLYTRVLFDSQWRNHLSHSPGSNEKGEGRREISFEHPILTYPPPNFLPTSPSFHQFRKSLKISSIVYIKRGAGLNLKEAISAKNLHTTENNRVQSSTVFIIDRKKKQFNYTFRNQVTLIL